MVEGRTLADQAMDALRRAMVAGYRNVAHVQNNNNLKTLRNRGDYKELVASLERIQKAEARRTPDAWLQAQQELLVVSKQLETAHSEDEMVLGPLADGYQRVGILQVELGQAGSAQSLDRAVAVRVKLIKDHPRGATYREDLVKTHLAIGEAYAKTNRLLEGMRARQDALAVLDAAARDGLPRDQLNTLKAATCNVVAEAQAQLGLWREAADQSEKALAANGSAPGQDKLYSRPAVARLRAGDLAGYRRVCAALAEHLNDKDPDVAQAVVRACVAGAESGIDPSRLVSAAERAAGERKYLRRLNLALACGRAGKWERALAEAVEAGRDPGWTGRVLSWPVLAIMHHRLGHAGQAQFWLAQCRNYWQLNCPLAADIAAASVIPPATAPWQEKWELWPTFEILFFEAAALIDGSPAVEAAADHLHRGLIYARLGDSERSEEAFRAAAALRPQDPRTALVRARFLIETGQDKRAAEEVERAAALKSPDARPWIEYGRFLAGRGRHEEADVVFARAAALTPNELNRFLEMGWWVAGPYPEGSRRPGPAETSLDPSKPIPGDDASGEVRWQPARTGSCGVVDLRAVFQADNASAYALAYVWLPEERSASLVIGCEGSVRVWLNGRHVLDVDRVETLPIWQDRVPVMLRAGRNTVLVKASHATGAHSLWVRLSDNPLDRGYVAARLTQWHEASALWTAAAVRGMVEHPNTRVYHATFMLAAGNETGFRQYRDGIIERYRQAPDNAYVFAYGAAIGSDPVPDVPWLQDLGRRIAFGSSNVLATRGLTMYRAGLFEDAIATYARITNFDAEPRGLVGLALAHHRLGHAEESKRWLAQATDWYDAHTKTALAAPHFQLPWEAWQYFPQFQILYQEARTAIEGSVPKGDPNLEALQARAAADLKKLDTTALDYDLAILLEADRSTALSRARQVPGRAEAVG